MSVLVAALLDKCKNRKMAILNTLADIARIEARPKR